MGSAATVVEVEHSHAVHPVHTTRARDGAAARAGAPEAVPASGGPTLAARKPSSNQYTLLELVQAIGEVTDDEREIVATVLHLLASGQVQLCGNFRGEPISCFEDALRS